VTLPNNFVTVSNAVTVDLGLSLPWPRHAEYQAPHADDPILIWGGSSSVGQHALQIPSSYGYHNLIAMASDSHRQLLQSFGANEVFDYKKADATAQILAFAKSLARTGPAIPFALDCIGSKSGTLTPIANIVQTETKVAVLLPVIVRDASDTVAPEYSMDMRVSANWTEGVIVTGVRTHFYLNGHM
jgi:NADPH:quinone reductase-like Zn-dependent oxidoreductase